MMSPARFRGLVAAAFTPMREDGALNLDRIPDIVGAWIAWTDRTGDRPSVQSPLLPCGPVRQAKLGRTRAVDGVFSDRMNRIFRIWSGRDWQSCFILSKLQEGEYFDVLFGIQCPCMSLTKPLSARCGRGAGGRLPGLSQWLNSLD